MRCCAAAAARHGGQVPGRGAKHWSYIVVIVDISHWTRGAVPRSVPRRSERMMTVTSVSYGPTPCSARYSASFSARGSVPVSASDEHERPTTGFQNGFEPLKAGCEAAHDRPRGGRHEMIMTVSLGLRPRSARKAETLVSRCGPS